MSLEEFTAGLGAELAAKQQPNGCWLCACGKRYGDAFSLYMHRKHQPCSAVFTAQPMSAHRWLENWLQEQGL